MELQPYLGNSLLKQIKDEVMTDVNTFHKKNDATKLQLATNNKLELEIYKQASKHLINSLEDTRKELEESENLVNAYKNNMAG